MTNRVVELAAIWRKVEERKEARKRLEEGKISFSDETVLPELQRVFEAGKSRGIFTRAELSYDDDSVEYVIYDATERPLFAIQKLLYGGRGFYSLRYKGRSIYHDEYIPPLLMTLRQKAKRIDSIVNKPPLGMRGKIPTFDFQQQ